MRTMSGRTHEVYTGFTILQASASLHISDFEITEVKFQDLSEAEITGYVETGDYEGKAGGYAVQGEAGIFVEWIKGDFYNVVGMPLNRIYRELKGIKCYNEQWVREFRFVRSLWIKESWICLKMKDRRSVC